MDKIDFCFTYFVKTHMAVRLMIFFFFYDCLPIKVFEFVMKQQWAFVEE